MPSAKNTSNKQRKRKPKTLIHVDPEVCKSSLCHSSMNEHDRCALYVASFSLSTSQQQDNYVMLFTT